MNFKTTFFLIVGIVIFVLYGTFFLFGKTSFQNQNHIRKEITKITKQNDSLRQILTEKTEKINKYENEPFSVEYLARTKFGMTKSGERAFQFISIE